MKIFVHDYAGHPFQCDLSRELARRRHTIFHAFAASNESPRGIMEKLPSDPETLSFLPIILPKTIKKNSYLQRRRLELQHAKFLSQYIQKEYPDIVISGNTPTEAQRLLLRTCQRMNIAFISWVQDIYGLAVHRILRKKIPILGSLVGITYIAIDRYVLKQSDAVIVISEDFVGFVRNAGVKGDRIFVVHNWAPISSIPLLPKNNPWSQKMGLANKRCIVYTGTLGMKHNPGMLLELAKYFRSVSDIYLVVISQGVAPDWLKAKAAEEGLSNIIVTDWVPQETLPEVLGAADILVAILEPDAGMFSVPSKVLTYLCSKKPIVLAVPPENLAARIVKQNNAGIVVPPNDTKEFIKAVENLIQDPQLGEQLGQNGRKYAETHFDIQKITNKFEEIFRIALSY